MEKEDAIYSANFTKKMVDIQTKAIKMWIEINFTENLIEMKK